MTPTSCVIAQEARQMDLPFCLHVIFWALLFMPAPLDVACHPFVKSAFSPRGLGVCFLHFFFFCCATCGNLVPQPGIEPARPKLEHEVLTTGPSGKSWTSGFDWRMVWNWASVHHVYCHCWCPGYQAWFMPVSRFLYLWNYPAQLFTSSVLLCSPPLKKSSWIKSVHLGSQKPCIQMPAQTLLSCLAFGP